MNRSRLDYRYRAARNRAGSSLLLRALVRQGVTKMVIEYLPFEQRRPDSQYHDLLRQIIEEGDEVETRQGALARRVIGPVMRFDLVNGFPVITERDLVTSSETNMRPSQFHQALGEICAFINGAQTQEELEYFGCFWWKEWVTTEKCAKRGLPTGNLGPGSYGAAFRRFPTAESESFDQITYLLDQMRKFPGLRTHVISPWIPQYLSRGGERNPRAVVAPCHGWVFVDLNPRTRELTLTHVQRSADVPVGLAFNLLHYAALTLMLSKVLNYRAKELVFFIHNAHIYTEGPGRESQLPAVERMLATEPGRFPTVTLEPHVENIFDFRPHHFLVTDYYPRLPRMRIWTPV